MNTVNPTGETQPVLDRFEQIRTNEVEICHSPFENAVSSLCYLNELYELCKLTPLISFLFARIAMGCKQGL